MANIKGIGLKGVKKFNGHEGEDCYQGDITLDGKVIGYFSDSYSMGGMDWHFIDKKTNKRNQEVEVEVDKRLKEYYSAYPKEDPMFEDMEFFIIDLISLNGIEKAFKSTIKKGGLGIGVNEGNNGTSIWQLFAENHFKEVNDKYPKAKFYRSLTDFDIE